MRELVVISGKGGTGKTSVVASFAALAVNCVIADCDTAYVQSFTYTATVFSNCFMSHLENVFVVAGGSAVVNNCTIVESEDVGDVREGASLAISNSILWSSLLADGPGETTVAYSDVQGGWPGIGNIDADPMFVDPSNGDYRLAPGSPCIDAGDNTAVPAGILTDLDGNRRFVIGTTMFQSTAEPRVDMGAYEYQPVSRVEVLLRVMYGSGRGGGGEAPRPTAVTCTSN